MRVPIQIHVSLCISLRSRNFFTHRAVVATSAQCFGIGTRIHFEQMREDCVSAFRRLKRTFFYYEQRSADVVFLNLASLHQYRVRTGNV